MLRCVPLLCCVCVALAGPGLVRAGQLPSGGEDELNKLQRTKNENMKKLLSGQDLGKDAADTYQFLAKWHTYRLTLPSVLQEGAVQKLLKDAEADLDKASKSKATYPAFLKEYGKQMAACTREVLYESGTPSQDAIGPIARVNVVRMLDRVAREGAEEVADVFVEILRNEVKDPSGNSVSLNDAVKYWALQGLKDLFAQGHVSADRATPVYLQNKEREKNCVLALIEFIERKPDLPATASRDEVEGQRVLRREAVKALALTRYPAVDDQKGRTALVLLRIARKEGFTPEPKIDEQVEAALGLARLQSDLSPNYQPDYAAHHIGWVIVDLANSYVKAGEDKVAEVGYKVTAARLTEALSVLKKDVEKNRKGDKDTVGYVNDVLKETSKILPLIETKGAVASGPLSQWLGGAPPKNDTIFRGMADAKVKGGVPAPG